MPCLQTLVSIFLERWPVIWAFDTGRYLLAASAFVATVWLVRRAGFVLQSIQTRLASSADMRREVLASLRSAATFSLVGLFVDQAARHGLFTIYTDFEAVGPAYAVAMLALVILAHDAYFYWTHRLMHLRPLYRRFHLLHHRSVTPTAWAAYAFAVPEALLQALFLPLLLIFLPLHAVTIFAWMAFQIVRNVMGHAGIEVHPLGMARSPWFGWNNTTTHHDLHHQTGRYNFGLYFTWWDRFMGTEHPDYLDEVDRARTPRRVAVSEAAE